MSALSRQEQKSARITDYQSQALFNNQVQQAIKDGNIIDVSYFSSTNTTPLISSMPKIMGDKFGPVSSNALTIAYDIDPLPLVSDNLQGYETAINLLNLSNSENYIRAWKDLWISKNVDKLSNTYKNYVSNLNREIDLVNLYTKSLGLLPKQRHELEELKNARLLFPIDDTIFTQSSIQQPVDEEAKRKHAQRQYRLVSIARKKLLNGELLTNEERQALDESDRKKAQQFQQPASVALAPLTNQLLIQQPIDEEAERKYKQRQYRLVSIARKKFRDGTPLNDQEQQALAEADRKLAQKAGLAPSVALAPNY
jgi:hypothetical protein